MKKFLFMILFVAALFVAPMGVIAQPDAGLGPVSSEPVAVPVLDVGMNLVSPAMAPKPAATVPKASAPVMAPTMAAEPPTVVPKAPTPEWKTGTFWVLKVVIPILLFVLGLLVTLGVIKKTWLEWLREKSAIKIADKVVNGFLSYAEGTKPVWDDVLAQVLKAVVTRLGELSPELEGKVKAVVADRKEQDKIKKLAG